MRSIVNEVTRFSVHDVARLHTKSSEQQYLQTLSGTYSIQGVQIQNPTKQWEQKHAQFREQFSLRKEALPAVFEAQQVTSWDTGIVEVVVHEALRPGAHEVMRLHTIGRYSARTEAVDQNLGTTLPRPEPVDVPVVLRSMLRHYLVLAHAP